MPGTPIRHAAAWMARDYPTKDSFAFDLGARHVAALEKAAAAVRGRRMEDIGPDAFDLSAIAEDVARVRDTVLHGRGFLLLRGFPVDRDLDTVMAMYWGLGAHLGRAVSQSLMGDRIGHVLDASRGNEHARGYRSARELDPHTDSDDVVGLLCLRPGIEGGESLLSCALHMHNVLLAEAPDQLRVLNRGFHYHWNGEEPEGEPPITSYPIPVFSEQEGTWSTVYLRHFINKAFDEAGGTPDEDKAALDAMDAVARRDDVQLRFRLEAGEAILFNNYTCLHARTSFVDHPDQGRHRHLLRLWLQARPPRPVHPAVRRYYGTDGMPFQARGAARYAGDTMAGSVSAA
ncbi:MAG: TauD/TfdA family dioxygenase [Alphaproteobacteria bacterium]|nr:TauD/TfdA family dioxygenase [Alphaproteobacteria bacterium]